MRRLPLALLPALTACATPLSPVEVTRFHLPDVARLGHGTLAVVAAPGADPAEQIEDEEYSASSSEALAAAVRQLDERSRDILEQRWMAPRKATLHELAARYGVSAERIRQIESSAIARLRRHLPSPETLATV